jgi:hypothetical protein
MRFVADENFPRPALEALRNAGWEIFSVAEECPGIADEEVAGLYSEGQRILLTFDKDFGELIFRRGLSAGSGVVLFRLIPEFSRRSRRRRLGTGEITARPQWDLLRYHTGSDSSPTNAPGFGALIIDTMPSKTPICRGGADFSCYGEFETPVRSTKTFQTLSKPQHLRI